MKLAGIAGTGSGKLGSQVYASVAGEQIVRNYQPQVANPNTTLQVNNRAKLKLMSQLSAVFAPVLTFRRKKLVSARNQFVSTNYDLASGNDGTSQISLENIQLTSGSAGLPGIRAWRDGRDSLHAELVADASGSVDRVVYIFYKKTSAQQLQLIGSVVASDAGADGIFPVAIDDQEGDIVIYAYGMKDLNASATAKYGNYSVITGEDVAHLFMSRGLNYNDYRFTRTRGCQLNAEETETQSVGRDQSRIFATASGPGEVTGAGIYDNRSIVVLNATPNEGCEFIGWKQNGGSEFIGYSRTLSFIAGGLVDVLAVFQNPESSTGGYDGEELTNPLPTTNIVVNVDGEEVAVVNGQLALAGNFDNLYIAGLAEGLTLTWVPIASYLGADDNVTLEWSSGDGGRYEYSMTDTNSGCVYLGANAYFYVLVDVVDLPENATFDVDGTAATIVDGLMTLADVPDYLKIHGVEAGQQIVYVPEGSYLGAADNDIFSYTEAGAQNSYYQNVTTGDIEEGAIYYNGMKWFNITVQTINLEVSINEGDFLPVVNGSVNVGSSSINTIFLKGLDSEHTITLYNAQMQVVGDFAWNDEMGVYLMDLVSAMNAPLYIGENGVSIVSLVSGN